ncbi:MAG: class I SAM-dependent methyltransferase [Gaiellaceae bacterium]
MTDAETVRREQGEIERRFGAWTAHNVRLAEGVYTISSEPAGDEVKLRRVTQIVSDLAGGELEGLRVLDLASLEGMYAFELARRGADVVAIEGREANIEKARFAARTLGLDSIRFLHGDVRALSRAEHGEFDVVLCLGILYHLDVPDLFELVERVSEVCRRALVVDTAVGTGGEEHRHDGHRYRGRRLTEHTPDSTEDERLAALWSSLDNVSAVALTRASLESLLARCGFTSVYECHVPAEPAKEIDRTTLLAIKGPPVGRLLSPQPAEDAASVPERPPLGRRLEASRFRALGRLVPPVLRARIRRILSAEMRHH